MFSHFQRKVTEQLESIGIVINGSNPWDIQVHNPNLYSRVLSKGTLGLGEAYMDGWWDCDQLDEMFYLTLKHSFHQKLKSKIDFFDYLKARIINMQSKKKAFQVGKEHYDVGNFLYQKMLDPLMNYTCGYWKDAHNLNQAQMAKIDLIAQKLYLKKDMSVLDIGCGFGGAARYISEKYGVKVIGITISKKQLTFARKNFQNDVTEFLYKDYRQLENDYYQKFDRIYSIGMFEHVGYKNYSQYFKIVNKILKDDGLFLLHTIGKNDSVIKTDAWIQRYIFANGMMPSIKQISESNENLFVMEDWHNFGCDYDKTLMAWLSNFKQNWNAINHFDPKKYDERFYRKWVYYLSCSAASFRTRHNQLWQIVFSKKQNPIAYLSIR